MYPKITEKGILTSENIEPGIKVVSTDNPEWGIWKIEYDDINKWSVNKIDGGKILAEHDYKFWTIVETEY